MKGILIYSRKRVVVDCAIVDDDSYILLNTFFWFMDNGYTSRAVTIDGVTRNILMHRQIMLAECGQLVDHFNRNRLDNRKGNLRIVTHQQNVKNQFRGRLTGVNKRGDLFEASITVDKVLHKLGSYISIEEAIEARIKGEQRLLGEYAPLR